MSNIHILTSDDIAAMLLVVALLGVLTGVLLRTGVDHSKAYRRGVTVGRQQTMREQAAGRRPTADERRAS